MVNWAAKDTKYGFGRLIAVARAVPVAVGKDGRSVEVVISVEESDRFKEPENARPIGSSLSATGWRTAAK